MTQNKKTNSAAATGAAALLLATLGSTVPAQAEVKLPLVISDGMVLQRRTQPRIWGTASPGEAVTVTIAGKESKTTAGPDGKWEVRLASMEAGGPYTLTVAGKNRIEIKDVLVGEVWVCSGQSNMEWNMGWLGNTKDEIASANDPQLRMFTVPKTVAFQPQTELTGGEWQTAVSKNVPTFSAVGYYFAKYLRKALGVPIGMIHTSWGGTRIEAWTRKEILLGIGTPASEFTGPTQETPAYKAAKARHDRLVERWKAAGSPRGPFADPGIAQTALGWEKPDAQTADWKPIRLPGAWEESGIEELEGLDGAVWFRKEVDVPASASGKAALLTLGAIDDYDQTFVNGVKVGGIGAETQNSWSEPRKYSVPEGVLRAGKNVIAVRVWDGQGAGGVTGPADQMKLTDASGAAIPLNGEWRYKVELGRLGDPGAGPDATNPNAASGLYNAMIAPIVHYTIKGAIWYQGESNAWGSMPYTYRKQMPTMIENWRTDWGIKDFPFLLVQLAPYMDINSQPAESEWASLREAQWLTTKAIPNVGMAVITDVGDEKDIHPQRKEPVGERLALLARRIAYKEKVASDGPIYKGMEVKDGKAILTFETSTQLVAKPTDSAGKSVAGGKLVGFSIAGADGKFVWADATIQGKNQVVVSSSQVPNPQAVRFGWANYPVVNLWNESLPATPFRTDIPK